jgi:uncharacterized protein YjbI with pentapeptide repeats
MAIETHVQQIRAGFDAWHKWRSREPECKPDVAGASLRGLDLSGFDLSECDLAHSDLSQCAIRNANLSKANLIGANLALTDFTDSKMPFADLRGVNCVSTKFRRCHLEGSDLFGVNLSAIDLNGADLSGAELGKAILTHADLRAARLNGARVFGVSAWEVYLDGAQQRDLVITRPPDPVITVDNLELAQFMFLLLKNEHIRSVIDAVTSKVVLILGRFTTERKFVLNCIREALRNRGFSPVLFDFEAPSSRDITETISILAHLSRFVIADLTDPRSIPQELMRIVPNLPSVPVQPVLLRGSAEYSMFEHLRRFPWVLPTFFYDDHVHLLESLDEHVIAPAVVNFEGKKHLR